MFQKKYLLYILITSCIAISSSCKKYLDEKPNQKLTTPATLDDLSQLLNDYDRMNGYYPSAGEISADNYYLTDEGWASTGSDFHRHLYKWEKFDEVGSDWASPYNAIMTANVILENLGKISLKSPIEKNKAKELEAMALFIRAYYHFALSQLFMPVYNEGSANNDMGIPLKRSSDINEKIVRATSQQTYDFIIADITQSIKHLPDYPDKKYLPSRPAAFGLLSRVYLSMQLYSKAGSYADSCLKLYNALTDYNSIAATNNAPFAQFNEEVIYDTQAAYPNGLYQGNAKVDSSLYNSYDTVDIRKQAYFSPNGDGTFFFKGNYTGKAFNPTMFTGIATDEMYLNRAECSVREGDSVKAIDDLNWLLRNRIKTADFVPYAIPVSGGLLKLILNERRKELLYRGLRWTDLRRLNKEPELADTLYRILNGQEYQLLPGSERYTLLIDRSTIDISGIDQNN